MSRIIGIDLGTTYSAVSVYEKKGDDGPGEAAVIRNLRGKETTPSVVSINKNAEIIVGWSAKNNLEYDPTNTVVEVKRMMGCSPEDVKAKTGGRGIVIGERDYLPEQVSAFILRDLKAAAERHLGEEVHDAIVTCPEYFGETQKAATKRAGILAGLNVHRVLPEPIAAAIAYGVENASDEEQTFVIYDLGGGTFDVSVITVDEQDIDVVGTAGDANLGGGDFDNAIVDWVVEEIRRRHGVDLGDDLAAKARIKAKAEDAKIQLSQSKSADLQIPFIAMKDGTPLGDTFTLSRAKFEIMVMKLLKKTISSVRDAIEEAKVKDTLLDEDSMTAILLVGGSSRIPRIQTMLEKEFPNIPVRCDLNPDQIVAQGAALAASNLAPVGKPPATDGSMDVEREGSVDDEEANTGIAFNIRNVVSHSLGIAVGPERKFHPILKKGDDIPKTAVVPEPSAQYQLTTGGPGATAVHVEVFEGEGQFVDAPDMTAVGKLEISGWEPGPMGCVSFRVEFTMDISGILNVMTTELINNIQVTGEFNRKDSIGAKSMDELAGEVETAKQAGVDDAPAAPPDDDAPSATDSTTPPPGLPEDYEGYWAEATGRLPDLDEDTAGALRDKMGAVQAATAAGDADAIEEACQALVEMIFDI